MAGRAWAFCEQDGDWLVVAALLEQASLVDGAAREALLRDAVEHADAVLGADEVAHLRKREWENRDISTSDAIVFLADRAHFADAVNLAGAILDTLLVADGSMSDIARGRIMSRLGRVAYRLDFPDEAVDRYRAVGRLGKRIGSDELRIRGWIGGMALSHIRGNLPQFARYARRAARLADEADLRGLSRVAHGGLAMAAARAKRYDEALGEAWISYQCALGDLEFEVVGLQTIGQVLLDSGNAAAARDAFSAIVAQPLVATFMLPALGGLALAAAGCGEEATLEWAVQEVLSIHRSTAPRYSVASALIECATALAAIGRSKEAERHRESALRLSRAHNFFALTHDAETLDTSRGHAVPGNAAFVGACAGHVAIHVRAISPRRLPVHVCVTAERSGG